MKLAPLRNIKDGQDSWKGTRLRQYEIGLDVTYILFFLLICVGGCKLGTVLTLVRTV